MRAIIGQSWTRLRTHNPRRPRPRAEPSTPTTRGSGGHNADLTEVRRSIDGWELPDRFATFAGGLEATYRRGRRGFRRAQKKATNERMHEWRKRVKYLWYQLRLLEPTAPSVLSPLVANLGDLADALGDDHDLAVLVDSLETEGDLFGGPDEVRPAIDLARRRQADLRHRAFSLGARVYAEEPEAFCTRIGAYWEIDRRQGAERRAGGIADLAGLDRDRSDDRMSVVERERKFLVTEPPALPSDGERIRQGYVAVDGKVSARVRDRTGSGLTLTIKSGSGPTRTELEWELDRPRFEILWPLAEGRRIDKTRYLIPLNGHTAELDVFEGDLAGLGWSRSSSRRTKPCWPSSRPRGSVRRSPTMSGSATPTSPCTALTWSRPVGVGRPVDPAPTDPDGVCALGRWTTHRGPLEVSAVPSLIWPATFCPNPPKEPEVGSSCVRAWHRATGRLVRVVASLILVARRPRYPVAVAAAPLPSPQPLPPLGS